MQWEGYQLKNGVQVFASRNGDALCSCLGFYFSRGSAVEDKRGLCCLWAEMLRAKLNQIAAGAVWTGWPDWDYTAFTANDCSLKAISAFFQCFISPNWTEEELARAKTQIASPKSPKKDRSFQEQMTSEYWRGSVYAVPVQASAQDLEGLSLKQVSKWHQGMVESGNLACVLTGRITEEQIQAVQMQASALKECKSEKKKKKVLPKEFGCRNVQAARITDLESGSAEAMISFDIPSKSSFLPALAFCLLLDAGGRAPVSWLLKDTLAAVQGIHCYLEKHEAASRLVLTVSLPSEELVGALRKCFSAFSYLKQGLKTEEAVELLEFWAQVRREFCKDAQKVNLHMGRYYCIAEEECKASINRQTPSSQEIREAAAQIFQPENMSVAISCQPGIVKRKKLQKVIMEARILLQGPEASPEESAEVRKKLLRQFIRDCQAETDSILSGEASRSTHQLWRKFQCYIRLRKAADSHYSFDGVQEFLLGHGYSKEDVKRLKKRKDREKSEGKGKKEDPQDDWQRIENWFFQDTIELIQALATGEPWQGATAAAVKRSNLCMRYKGRTERGIDAVKAMLDGKETDLTRIQAYLEAKNAGKNDAETHTDGIAERIGEK